VASEQDAATELATAAAKTEGARGARGAVAEADELEQAPADGTMLADDAHHGRGSAMIAEQVARVARGDAAQREYSRWRWFAHGGKDGGAWHFVSSRPAVAGAPDLDASAQARSGWQRTAHGWTESTPSALTALTALKAVPPERNVSDGEARPQEPHERRSVLLLDRRRRRRRLLTRLWSIRGGWGHRLILRRVLR
jgi:hypothetical protein